MSVYPRGISTLAAIGYRWGIWPIVALYTALPFLTGQAADVPGADAEVVAQWAFSQTWEPHRYYGHLLYFVLRPQTYYFLTPAIIMAPAIFMGTRRWFMAWIWVLFGSAGYLHHMMAGSFLPIINYMIFIPLNLYLLQCISQRNKHHRWLIVSMFTSLMFHGSSGIIIQAGTIVCMIFEMHKIKDWIKIAPLAILALILYAVNHHFAPSAFSDVVKDVYGQNNGWDNYLKVLRMGGILSHYNFANNLAVNWTLFYFGLSVIPAAIVLSIAAMGRARYIRQLACFAILPIGIIIGWVAMPELRPHTFDVVDRAASALSVIIFMGAGLAFSDLLGVSRRAE